MDEDRVLDVAVEAFAEGGPSAVTVEEIARRAGITKPVLYNRFGNKEALFAAAVAAEAARLADHVLSRYEVAETLPPAQAMRVRMAAIFEYAKARPAGFRLLHHPSVATPTVLGPGIAAVTARTEGLVRQALRNRGRRPDPRIAEILAASLVGMSMSVAARYAAEPDWDSGAAVELMAEFVRGGLDTALGPLPTAAQGDR